MAFGLSQEAVKALDSKLDAKAQSTVKGCTRQVKSETSLWEAVAVLQVRREKDSPEVGEDGRLGKFEAISGL